MDEPILTNSTEGRETGKSAFAGFGALTWTQAPDEPLSVLGGSQLQVLRYVARHTAGQAREGGERVSRVRAAGRLLRRAITAKQGDELPGCVREAVASASLQVAAGEEEPLEPARVLLDLLRGGSARLADALVISPAPEVRHRAVRLRSCHDGPAGERVARELSSRHGRLEPLELDPGRGDHEASSRASRGASGRAESRATSRRCAGRMLPSRGEVGGASARDPTCGRARRRAGSCSGERNGGEEECSRS